MASLTTHGYGVGNLGRVIEVINTAKEPAIKYTRDSYNGLYTLPTPEIEKIVAHLKAIDLKFSDIGPNVYSSIVKKCERVPLWVMSDVINYGAPARGADASSFTVTKILGRTSDFAKYLVDNKIGFVMASPIVQNPSHRVKTNYSLNQGWFWIPPMHLDRAVNVARIYGREKFPPRKQWVEKIGTDLELNDPKTILKSVLNGGVFPKEARFTRSKEVATAA